MSSIYLSYFVVFSHEKRAGRFIWTNLSPHHPRMLCAKKNLEKNIFWYRPCIFANFVIISPWKRIGPFLWTNLKSIYQRMNCAKFGRNWHSGSGEDLLISSMYFHYFIITCISPWKRAGPFFEQTWIPFTQGWIVFIWRNSNPVYRKMLCARFGWNWPSCSGEDD